MGVFANQPSPHKGKVAWYWAIFAVLALLVVVAGLVRAASAAREQVFAGSYEFQPTSIDSSFVTETFRVTRDSNLELTISTNLTNNWAYFNFALINSDTGDALDFGREVSYYYGTDSDGRWTEGSAVDVATLSTVDAGTYYLRVEPESGTQGGPPVNYSLKIRRDVPSPVYYVLAFVRAAGAAHLRHDARRKLSRHGGGRRAISRMTTTDAGTEFGRIVRRPEL